MKKQLKRLMGVLGLAALLASGGSQARADLNVEFVSATGAPSNFTYTYNVNLQPGSQLVPAGGGNNTANFFTLYDIAGLIAGSETSTLSGAPWAITEQTPGVNPFATAAPDGGGTNITFRDVDFAATVAPNAPPLLLGQVTFRSTLAASPINNVFYASATQDSISPTVEFNGINRVIGPNAVPEPGSLALAAGMALVFGGGTLLRRRRSRA